MRLDLRTSIHHPGHYEGHADASIEEVHLPVAYDFSVKRRAGGYVLDGTLSIVYNLLCARCLKPFSRSETVPLHVVLMSNMHEDAQTIADEDEDIVYYENEEEVDLTEYLQGEVLLGVPSKAVCSHTCKGLCPVCGESIESEHCTCKTERIDAKWAKLNDIKRELYGGD